MPGIRVVSERQLELLLQFMEKNPILAKGSLTNEGPLAKLTTEKKWKTIAARLNNEGSGCNKSHIKWREYWNQQKYNARKKATKIRQRFLATGGGPLHPKFKLSARDKRILVLMRSVAVYGEPSRGRETTTLRRGSRSPELLQVAPDASRRLGSSSPEPPQVASDTSRRLGKTSTELLQVKEERKSPEALRRPNHSETPAPPDWVIQLEERRLAVEEGIGGALQQLNVTLQGMREAMESVAQSLQAFSRHLDIK